MSKLIVGLIVCSLFVFYPAAGKTAEPNLGQCRGEPSKGTGWGTFWIVTGVLNAAGGIAILSLPEKYKDVYDPKSIGVASIGIGAGLSALGVYMHFSSRAYNKACAALLSGVNVEPLTDEGTNVGLVYRYRW